MRTFITSKNKYLSNDMKIFRTYSIPLNSLKMFTMQGLREPSPDAIDESEAVILATQWKSKYNRHREIETTSACKDELGLRIVSRNTTPPGLTQIVTRKYNEPHS